MLLSLLSATTAMAAQQPTAFDSVANGQVYVPSGAVPSTEVNAVEESRLTQEMEQVEKKTKGMTQAEKAENAKENDEYGLGITLVAMSIVLLALIVLSILFYFFGQISARLLRRQKMKAQGIHRHEATDKHKDLDSGEVIAAISMALAEHLDGKGHDMERTILTLRRMKRAYSPWNSKIYNIRHVPEQPVSKNRL